MADVGEVRVALASLVKMINLLGAELLVGKYREDIDVFEQSVRGKLFANVDGVSAEATAAGVALAHSLIDPVLKNLRSRVAAMHAAERAVTAQAETLPRRLN